MTFHGTCRTCDTRHTAGTWQEVARLIWDCDRADRGLPADYASNVAQLLSVSFHEQAVRAIKALAMTGRNFTVGEAHQMVSVEPANPRTDWETARKDAERLGYIEWTGEFAESVVPTSKHSAVKVWKGAFAMTRRGAA